LIDVVRRDPTEARLIIEKMLQSKTAGVRKYFAGFDIKREFQTMQDRYMELSSPHL
jgi:hypothetical protein